jgi:Exostosin family
MSTCIMVLLLSVGSFLESWESIRQTKSKRLVSRREVLRQQKIRNQLHVNTGKAASGRSINVDADINRQQRQPVARLQPYSSMFAAPQSDWIPKEKTAAASSPMLRVYIYDTLPAQYTSHVKTCIMKLSGVLDAVTTFSSISTKMADIALIQLFETYPGRVYDATEADLYVVPYPHASHCYCAHGWERACAQVNATAIDVIMSRLTYYNDRTAARHMFLLSGVQQFTHPRLLAQPFKLIGGNLSPEQVLEKNRGTIVIPYLNDKARFQEIFTAPASWWTRPRRYAFSFVFGQSSHQRDDPRRVRKLFHLDWIQRNQTELGGLPVYIQAFDHVASAPKDTVWKAFDRYHDSIFCPILAGDSCQQARFFDVMYAGCIPVVLDYSATDVSKHSQEHAWVANLTSWYRQGGETTAAVYPFHRSLVDFGIDYQSCVLTVPAVHQQDVQKLVPAMEYTILHQPDRIRQWQTSLQNCAVRTAFGMGRNAHKHNDAFAQIMRMIQYHLEEVRPGNADA